MLIHVVNAQVALGEAQLENADLRRQLDDRETLRALEGDMDFQIDGGFYVRRSESSKGLIAYCPVCWQKDGKTIPLEVHDKLGNFWCSVHKNDYRTNAYMTREIQRSRQEIPSA